MHQGNLFVKADRTIAAVDFDHGADQPTGALLAREILYGLTTGNYRRVAEIHFEAQYVRDYHSVEEFATALRAVGEPMRGKPVSELSVGQMLDGLLRSPATSTCRPSRICCYCKKRGDGRA